MWLTDWYFQKSSYSLGFGFCLGTIIIIIIDAFLSKKLEKLNCKNDYRNAEAFSKRFKTKHRINSD